MRRVRASQESRTLQNPTGWPAFAGHDILFGCRRELVRISPHQFIKLGSRERRCGTLRRGQRAPFRQRQRPECLRRQAETAEAEAQPVAPAKGWLSSPCAIASLLERAGAP